MTITDHDALSKEVHHHETIVLGAGVAGIGAAVQLRNAGLQFVVLEKTTAVGGVWRENTYPGCACDVPSMFYSYSFAPSSKWKRFYGKQPEIRQYLDSGGHCGAVRCLL